MVVHAHDLKVVLGRKIHVWYKWWS